MAPQTVYAGGLSVFKTVDGGEVWIPMTQGLPKNKSTFSLAIDPSSPQTVYSGNDKGVYKSTDGGANWVEMNNGLIIASVFALLVDPSHPQIVYAGTERGDIFKSTDGAGSWTRMNNGRDRDIVYVLTFRSPDLDDIYAGTAGGIDHSSNGTSSWNTLALALPDQTVQSLVADVGPARMVFAGTERNGVFAVALP